MGLPENYPALEGINLIDNLTIESLRVNVILQPTTNTATLPRLAYVHHRHRHLPQHRKLITMEETM